MKKGFTLIELLSVIIILGIIVAIVTPMISSQIELAQDEAYNLTVKTIEDAASKYGTKYPLGYDEDEKRMELSTLIDEGLINENDLINPKTDAKMTGCVYYKWNSSNKVFEYRYDPDC